MPEYKLKQCLGPDCDKMIKATPEWRLCDRCRANNNRVSTGSVPTNSSSVNIGGDSDYGSGDGE